MKSNNQHQLHFQLLGHPIVALNGKELTELGAAKVQAMIYYLAATAKPAPRAVLADLLWPKADPIKARRYLSQHLTLLRQDFAPFLSITNEALALTNQSAITVDLHQMREYLMQARRFPADLTWLRQAVACYHGPFLAQFHIVHVSTFDHWMDTIRAEVDSQITESLWRLAQAGVDAGNSQQAHKDLDQLLTIAPWHEAAHRLKMLLFARQGLIGEAIGQYQRCCTQLVKELGSAPDAETEALIAQIRAGKIDVTSEAVTKPMPLAISSAKPTEYPTLAARPGNVRPHTERLHRAPAPIRPLVGHADLLEKGKAYLQRQDCRLITLLGMGGVGKSHLALTLAEHMAAEFADGVCWVPLVDVGRQLAVDRTETPAEGNHTPDETEQGYQFTKVEQDPGTTIQALVESIANALRLPPSSDQSLEDVVVDYLQTRHLLLILDNFEQLHSAAYWVVELLQMAPKLTVLITSQVRLGLMAEIVLVMPPLPVPDEVIMEPAQATTYASLQLFIAHGQQHLPTFAVTTANLPHIIRICQLVQGLPLAIEMVAAWVAHMNPAEIAAKLMEDLSLLECRAPDLPQHQHTIMATLDYSWQLLTPKEVHAATQLLLFVGGMSRHALESILDVEVPIIQKLVDKSILRAVDTGCYELHSLIQRFILQKHMTHPALNRAVQTKTQYRYCHYYLNLLVVETAHLNRPEAVEALAHLRRELSNIQRAWHYAQNAALNVLMMESIDALILFYGRIGFYDEAVATCQNVLVLQQSKSAQAMAWQNHLVTLAMVNLVDIHLQLQRYQEALHYARQAIEFASTCKDAYFLMCRSNCALGQALTHTQKHGEAYIYLHEARQIAEEYDLVDLQGRGHESLAYLYSEGGDYQQALMHGQCAYASYKKVDNLRGMALAIYRMAPVEIDRGLWEQAGKHLTEARIYQQKINDQIGESRTLNLIACNYAGQFRYAESILAWQEAEKNSLAAGNIHFLATILSNLAWAYTQLGLYDNAVSCIYKGLPIDEASGDPSYICVTLCNLSVATRLQGGHDEAVALSQRALYYARQARQVSALPSAYAAAGQAHLAIGSLEEAQSSLTDSLVHALEHELLTFEIDARMGLAELYLHQNQFDEAMTQTEVLLSLLSEQPILLELAEHLRPHWICYQVLYKMGDSRADELLIRTHAQLLEWANRISDEALRNSYLQNVDAHRQIVNSYLSITTPQPC
ncbi:MAG: tetratricopeptide repeat protein [Caldilineaceae bacterium]|nr:tetratricopeptide repeat protein [Caldilineaceae bacterium]